MPYQAIKCHGKHAHTFGGELAVVDITDVNGGCWLKRGVEFQSYVRMMQKAEQSGVNEIEF